MKRLSILLFAALSAIAQEVAIRAPQHAPNEYERMGLTGVLMVAVGVQYRENRQKDRENRELTERVAGLAEKMTEATKQMEKAIELLGGK